MKLGRTHGLFLNPGKSFSYRLRHSALPHKLPDIIKTYQTSLSYLMKLTIKDIPADASAQPSPV